MTSILRRGACPSLSAPMATGDGLLARLNPCGGALSPPQLVGVAKAALQHGNGLVEITSRGSLQIRGLREETVAPFTDAVAALAIVSNEGVEIRTGALAGCDASEIADPLPVAAAIRAGVAARGLSGRLAPKVSVIVDGGGALGLGALGADLRLEALAGDGKARWRLSVAVETGGRGVVLDRAKAEEAVECCLDCLAVLAANGPASRARDLPWQAFAHAGHGMKTEEFQLAALKPAMPVGEFLLHSGAVARGFALPFGQAGGRDLAAFAGQLDPDRALRLAPGRGLLVLGLTPGESERIAAAARAYGLVTKADDPRLRIVACAGAPACASAHLPTREIAAAIASRESDLLPDGAVLHLSGCAKKCARPAGPSLELIGSPSGWTIEEHDMCADNERLRSLTCIAAEFGPRKRRLA